MTRILDTVVNPQHRELLLLLAHGKTVAEAAKQLNIPVKTAHLWAFYARQKTGCKTTYHMMYRLGYEASP